MRRRRTRQRLLRAAARAVGFVADVIERAAIWCMTMAGRGILSALTLVRWKPFESLRGQVNGHGAKATDGRAQAEVSAEAAEARQLAVEVLVAWGDRRADAKRWVADAAVLNPGIEDAGELIRAAYRMRTNRQVGHRDARCAPASRGG